MSDPISAAFSFFAEPVAKLVGGWQATRAIAAKSKARIKIIKAKAKEKTALLKGELKAKEIQAKIDRKANQDNADARHDELVLENRRYTIADELLITFLLTIVAMHFIPVTQPYMLEGWKALDKAPWWFQLAMVIILITTLGGMRILRIFINGGFSFGKGK